jgi:hypothetical protein
LKPAGVKTTELRNSTDHQSGRSWSVGSTNSDQLWRVPDVFGFLWKKEETLVIILKENGSEDPSKPQFSNRPLSVESGTLQREKTGAGFKRGCIDHVVGRVVDRVVDSVSAVGVCFEKDLKFLAIELLVAVLIPISEVRFGA